MAPGTRSPSIDELLAHAGWMRSLAREIVRDPALADDVVQDAWLAALARPPEPRSPAGLRAWLSGVVSNLARSRRRRESARAAVERRAARPEATSSDLDALERLHLQRELADLLLELKEPQRSAVILRHLEGLSSEQIGLRAGCSAEAARQRVARGLAELRQKLEARRARGGADRMPALATLARASESAAVAAGTGVLIMSKSAWSVAGVAAGVLLTWMAWSALRAAPPSAGSPPDSGVALVMETSAVDPSAPAPDAARPAPEPGSRSAAGLAAPAPRATVVVRDREGVPVEGVSIGERGSAWPWGTTDEEGRFVLSADLVPAGGGAIPAGASHDDFLSAELELQAGETRTLKLARKPRVMFELAAPDGSVPPRPWEASVWVRDASTGEVVQVRAEQAEQTGELTALRLPLGRLERADARARGFGRGQRAFEARLEPDAVVRARIDLTRGAHVRGRVVDKETREPIAGSKVWAEGAFFDEQSVTEWSITDAEGRFELRGLEGQEVHGEHGVILRDVLWLQVSAKAEGYQGRLLEGKVLQTNAEHVYDIELELTRTSCLLSGWVRGMEGLTKPILVQAVSANGQFEFEYAGSDGRFEFDELEPGVVWLFASNAYGSPSEQAEATDPRVCARGNVPLEPGERKEIELALERGSAGAAGHVVDTEGKPVAGIEVRAHLNARLGMIAWGAFHWSTRTNEQGAFEFDELLSGDYGLEFGELPERWCVLEELWSFELGPGEQRTGGRLVLSDCSSVEGWVELAGRDPASLRVQARGPGDRGFDAESPVASDASFRLTRLPKVELEIVLLEGKLELARVPVGARGAKGVQLRAGP